MSDLEDRGESTRSKTGSKPRASAKVRSKPSTVQVADVQLPEAQVEVDKQVVTQSVSNADKWIKFVAWFLVMGVLLGYGMYQHDNSVLFGVMVLVTVGCGYGNAVEVLIKFLDAKGIHPMKPLKTE